MSGNYQIGWAEGNLVPPKKVRLAGQFFERITDEVETPITCTALTLRAGEETMILCSCEILYVSTTLVRAIRERIRAAAPELPAEKVIISATHVHTAPEYTDYSDNLSSLNVLRRYLPDAPEPPADPDVMTDDEALEFLADRIADCIVRSYHSAAPGEIVAGFGRAAVGLCRRTVYDDGSALMWGDTNAANFYRLEAGNDSGIELLYFFDENKTLTGVAANIACPAQVVEHRSFLSSDYWGKVKILLREKFGPDLFLLPLCAAAGDQCPRDMIRWTPPETPIDDPNISRDVILPRRADGSMFDVGGTWKLGKRIAHEIIDVYEELEYVPQELNFQHRVAYLDLPVRRVTRKEKAVAEEALARFLERAQGEVTGDDLAQMHIHAGTLTRYEMQQHTDVRTVELHFVRVGDVVFATNPFELFLDYGNRIRARSPATQTFLVQLALGSYEYLPTAEAEAGSHYSAYVSSGMTGHEGGELLVRKSVEEIRGLWK